MTLSMFRVAVFCGIAPLCFSAAPALANESVPTTWNDLRTDAYALVESEQIDEALALIEQTAPSLPDRGYEISNLKMETLFEAGRTEEAMDVWEQGVDEGYFYFVIPRSQTYEDVRKTERFRSALARNNQLRNAANEASQPSFEIIKPASYSPDRTYPMVMVIHGGNQSIVKAKGRWDPQAFGDDLIIAYVQSSRLAATKSYRWDLRGVDIYSRGMAQDEVLSMYREIVGRYPVDTEKVTLVGFSQGGNLALFMAAEGTIPAKGLIAGCPATQSPVSLETARAAASRGLTGTIFAGADDWTAAAAQTTVDNFAEAGISINHIVMEDKGHEFPDDFDMVLRDAVEKIYR